MIASDNYHANELNDETTPSISANIEKLERYSMLASAIAGKQVLITATDHSLAYTDGKVIYIPKAINLNYLLETIFVQAALLAAGSCNPYLTAKLIGRKQARQRYLVFEVVRAMHFLKPFVSRRMFDLVTHDYEDSVTSTSNESLERAINLTIPVPEAPEWFGVLRPWKLIQAGSVNTESPFEQDVSDSTKARQNRPELDEEEDADRSKIMEMIAGPVMQNPLSNFLQNLLGAGRSPSTEGSGGSEVSSGMQSGEVGEHGKVIKLKLKLAQLIFGKPPIGERYHEWDVHNQCYKEKFCAVAECEWQGRNNNEPLKPSKDRRLKKELARLGLAHKRLRRQIQGEDLDINALVECMVNQKTGISGDDCVYEARLRSGSELGVLILLDTTGSTGETAHGKKVFEYQREIVSRLTSSFEDLGNRVATYGFFSRGASNVRFIRIKGFDERYEGEAKRRLSGLEPIGFTRLGAAIRHGTKVLNTRAGTPHKLLIVVGDGLPYDQDYESTYAQADSSKSLQEAINSGVACACISASSAIDKTIVEGVWGHVAHCQVKSHEELPARARLLFSSALREVLTCN